MHNTVIRFYRKQNYGNEQFYALDHADTISALTSRKTMLKTDMDALKELGFTLKEVLRSETGL